MFIANIQVKVKAQGNVFPYYHRVLGYWFWRGVRIRLPAVRDKGMKKLEITNSCQLIWDVTQGGGAWPRERGAVLWTLRIASLEDRLGGLEERWV